MMTIPKVDRLWLVFGRSLAILRDDLLTVVVMFTLAGVGGFLLVLHRQAHRPHHPVITLEEMRTFAATGQALILDARSASDYAAGHIPNALSLPIAEWKTRSIELRHTLRRHRDRLVVVYCADNWCGQAEELQLALIDIGYARVGLFSAGFRTWCESGLPVARAP